MEPYSRVTIDHITKCIGLSSTLIEQKLCQMILDKVLNGILDQNENCLVVLEEPVYDVSSILCVGRMATTTC